MARYDFGGTLADFVISTRRLGGIDVLGLASATLTFWSAQTGGTRYTDLTLNGSAASSISVGTDGQVPTFQGPDAVTAMWADGGAGRTRIVAQGVPGPAGPPGSGGLNSVDAAKTASATLTAGHHTPVDATASALTMTLPTTAAAGALLSVEKTDASTNAVNVTGTLRGVAAQTIALTAQYDARTFLSEGSGSWRPVSDHRTSASLKASFAPRSATHPRPVLGGDKLRGGNVVPKGSAIRDASLVPGRQNWHQMWTEWDWNGWIKPQIDAAKAAGANAIRIIGGLDAVLFNARPQLGLTYRMTPMATFLARTRQWIEYCASLGMYAYPTGGDISSFPRAAAGTGPDWSQAEIIPLLQQWAAVCDEYPNVIGLDVLQETFYTIDNTTWLPPEVPLANRSLDLHTWCHQVIDALRPYTSLPMTFSHPTNDSTVNGLADAYHLPRAAAYMDYLDFHTYFSVPAEQLNFATQQGRPIILGETGLPKDNPATTRGYFYERVAVVLSREELSGAFSWGISDQAPDSSPGLQMGMYAATYDSNGLTNGVGAGIPEVLAGFATWPRRTNPTGRSAFGFPYTVDPGQIRASPDNLPMPGVNQGVYARVRDAGWVTKVGLEVVVSSGNISVAGYANTGSGRTAAPGTQLATSGAVACPAVGYREIALTRPMFLRAGDWLFLSADNTTAVFRSLLGAQADSNLGQGRQYRQVTAHPAPATAGTLVATVGGTIVLIGVT